MPYIPLYSQKQPLWALVSLLSFWTSTSCPPRRRFHRVWMEISPEVVTCYRRCGTFISMAGSLNASSWDDGYSDPQEGKGRWGKWRIMLKAHQKNETPFVNFKNPIYIRIYIFCLSGVTLSKASTRIGTVYLFLFVQFFLRVLLKEHAFNIKTILGDREFVETYAPLEHWFSFQWEQIWSMAENRLRPASWVSAGRDVFLWTIWRCLLQQLWYLFRGFFFYTGVSTNEIICMVDVLCWKKGGFLELPC